jgi:Leucine-rich repeat (LRR) protein
MDIAESASEEPPATLPDDNLIDILGRLPWTGVLTLERTCKAWRNLEVPWAGDVVCHFQQLSPARYEAAVQSLSRHIGQISSLTVATYSHTSLPDDIFSGARKLQSLKLVGTKLAACPSSLTCLSGLTELIWTTMQPPASISQLTALRELTIAHRNASKVTPLPEFHNLTNLEYLTLDCSGLTTFPSSISELCSLECLCIKLINDLPELPDHLFPSLPSLKCLSIVSGHLQHLPATISALTCLFFLHLNCPLVTLPDAFSHLQSLQELRLHNCKPMQHLPQVLSHLQQLQLLTMDVNKPSEFFTTPALAHLTSLTTLHIDSPSLESLPNPFLLLTSLRDFTLSSMALHHLVATPSMTLRTLVIDCDLLSYFPAIIPETLPHLQSLTLQAQHLTRLPVNFFTALTTLTFLDLGCSALQALPPGLRLLSHLSSFSIISDAIQSLPTHDFSYLTSLRKLYVCSRSIECIPPSIFLCSSLTSLAFVLFNEASFYELGSPHNFGLLSNLQELRLTGDGLSTLPEEGWEMLRSLTLLSISGFKLSCLPRKIWQLPQLERLRIKCSNYRELVRKQVPWTWSLDTEVVWVPWGHGEYYPEQY